MHDQPVGSAEAHPVSGATLRVDPAPAGRIALVATDGSDSAIAAARRAVELLHPDLGLCLVTVMPPEYDPMDDEGGFEGPVMTQEQADREHQEALTNSGAALAATGRAVDGPTRSEIITSELRPADALVALARDRAAAILVVGHEQHGILRELFTGSVAERVVRRSTCPVLVVPIVEE